MNGIIIVLVLFGYFETIYSVKSLDISEDGFCLPSQHSCNGIACIEEIKICDGIEECADGSDEGNCAAETSCLYGKHLCKKTTGTTECLNYYSYHHYKHLCQGCGEPPSIDNGNIILENITENSAIGAWGKVMCNDGYESCSSMVRCLPSGVWTTATCEPVPQEETDGCFKQLGECTDSIYAQSLHIALRSTGCNDFCQCAYSGTNNDGSVSFKWVQKSCAPGTKLNMNLSPPGCDHAHNVACSGISCFSCQNENSHESCNDNSLELCDDNKQSCETVIEYDHYKNVKKILFKGCMNPTSSAANETLGCENTGSNILCRDKCVTNECNHDHILTYGE